MAKSEIPNDFEEALLDPTAIFRNPRDVLQRAGITRSQKIEILRRWEYDARALEVAEEENMAGTQLSDVLDRVLNALHALGASPDLEHTPPIKLGGHYRKPADHPFGRVLRQAVAPGSRMQHIGPGINARRTRNA